MKEIILSYIPELGCPDDGRDSGYMNLEQAKRTN